ncbi:MAG: hypothetical protein AB7I30_08325 [Isosphaeraceae bacterium]
MIESNSFGFFDRDFEPTRSRWWTSVRAGVVALATLIRLGWALAVPVEPTSDCFAYELLARNLAEGHGYGFAPGQPSAYWPVGTSAVYAVLQGVMGPERWHVGAVGLNLALGALTVWLSMTMTRDWFGPRAGLCAGLLMAFWPGQVEFTTLLASELPFNACVLLALFAEGRDRWRPWVRVMFTGLALASASYVRPLALPLPLILAWCRLVGPAAGSRTPRRVLLETAGVLAVMAVVIAPWTLRNARVLGRPVLISTNGGANLWMGNHPGSDGGYTELPPSVEALPEVQRDDLLGAEAKRFIREHPGTFARGALKKLVMTHDRENIGVVWNQPALSRKYGDRVLMPLKLLSTGYWWGALALGLVGAGVALRRLGILRASGLPPLALWGFFAAVHAVIVGGDRYHYPSVPFLAALAGLAIVSTWSRSRST